jgi:hypothetical protein
MLTRATEPLTLLMKHPRNRQVANLVRRTRCPTACAYHGMISPDFLAARFSARLAGVGPAGAEVCVG